MIRISLRSLLAASLALMLGPLALLLTRSRWLALLGRWLAAPPQPGTADAVVALGGSDARLLHAIALYRQGRGAELWYTGDMPIPGQSRLTFGDNARRIAFAGGVPLDRMRVLASQSTWEDAEAIAAEAQRAGSASVLLVTDWYHSRRLLGAVRLRLAGSGVRVYYEPAANSPFAPGDWWRSELGLVAVVSEVLRILYYWRRYGMAPWKL